MKSETLHKFLTHRGYKHEGPHRFDADYVVANYYRTDRSRSDVPDCLCNDKPPQFCIQESVIGGSYTLRVGIRNEAPQGWVDFGFYSVTEADLMERLDEMERVIIEAWKVLF